MISQFRLKRQLSGIIACLEEERRMLVSGELGALPGKVAEREGMIAALPTRVTEPDTGMAPLLGEIKDKAKRNASLMEAALAGLRDGNDVLDRIRREQAKLGTYDAKGTVAPTAVARPRHERRA